MNILKKSVSFLLNSKVKLSFFDKPCLQLHKVCIFSLKIFKRSLNKSFFSSAVSNGLGKVALSFYNSFILLQISTFIPSFESNKNSFWSLTNLSINFLEPLQSSGSSIKV